MGLKGNQGTLRGAYVLTLTKKAYIIRLFQMQAKRKEEQRQSFGRTPHPPGFPNIIIEYDL